MWSHNRALTFWLHNAFVIDIPEINVFIVSEHFKNFIHTVANYLQCWWCLSWEFWSSTLWILQRKWMNFVVLKISYPNTNHFFSLFMFLIFMGQIIHSITLLHWLHYSVRERRFCSVFSLHPSHVSFFPSIFSPIHSLVRLPSVCGYNALSFSPVTCSESPISAYSETIQF